MAFAAGDRVSRYRLIDKLGEGGMGVVWRAHDESLDREIAVKLLPEEFADDPERRARFEREAKAVAALNHPNIVTIYSVEQAEAAGRTRVMPPPTGEMSIPLTTCLAGSRAAAQVGARFLVVFTQSGFSAMQTARFRPPTPVLAFTPDEAVCRRLRMHWGLAPDRKSTTRAVADSSRPIMEG